MLFGTIRKIKLLIKEPYQLYVINYESTGVYLLLFSVISE